MNKRAWGYVIASILVYFCTGIIFDIIKDKPVGLQIIRYYYVDNEKLPYLFCDFIFWVGESVAWMLIAIGISLNEKWQFRKAILRMVIDWQIVEILFLLIANPYTVNRSKWICVGLTIIAFIIHTAIINLRRLLKNT